MKLSKDKVREIFMAHGFTVKDGQTDLKPYVYAAAEALAEAAVQAEREGAGEPHEQPGFVRYEWRWHDEPLGWKACDFAHYCAARAQHPDIMVTRVLYTHPPQTVSSSASAAPGTSSMTDRTGAGSPPVRQVRHEP